MVDFKLDTSGLIDFGPHPDIVLPDPFAFTRYIAWDDLSPFAQGYIEALFASRVGTRTGDTTLGVLYGFSDLSPEALALILKDCEVYERHYPMKPFAEYRRARGAAFWAERNSGIRTSDWAPVHFYPQAVSLGDDGKIHPSPSHEHGAAK